MRPQLEKQVGRTGGKMGEIRPGHGSDHTKGLAEGDSLPVLR